MSDLEKPAYMSLQASIRRVLSAHQAVIEGIATHAEKEQSARQAINHKREQDLSLTVRPGNAVTRL